MGSSPVSSDQEQMETDALSDERFVSDERLMTDRRAFFKASIAIGAMVVVPFAASASIAVAQQTDIDFMTLSQFLTGHKTLNADTAKATRSAFLPIVPNFDQRLIELSQAIKSQNAATIDHFDLSKIDKGLADLARKIIAGWYSGIVGNDGNAKLLAFDQALMFDPIRDSVVVPTFCSWGPNYWTAAAPIVNAPS